MSNRKNGRIRKANYGAHTRKYSKGKKKMRVRYTTIPC